MNKPTAVIIFALAMLAIVFGAYRHSNGNAKGFGYFLAVWLVPFVIASLFALLIAWDQSY